MATVKRIFPVTGMTCASCVLQVEKALRAEPGVEQATVNLANNIAYVTGEGAALDGERLRQAVRRMGYDLLIGEPDDAAAEAARAQERHLARSQRRLWMAAALCVPQVFIAMVHMHAPWANWSMWLLSTPVVLVLGRDMFINAWRQARQGQANMDTLVALSTGVAYAFSVFNVLVPSFWTARGLQSHVHFETASVIITFILLGKFLEERGKAGTGMAIRKLMNLRPNSALRERPDGTVEVPISDIEVDDVLLVRPGERIAVDGVVLSGESHVDESMISGEPLPVAKVPGAELLAGTINQHGSLRMRAQKVGAATLLAQIVRAVQEAQGSKAPVQRLVDKVAGIFVPVVMAIALLSAVCWWLSGADEAFTRGSLALITVLVIAC
ncbi:MAG: heavy metal translocating P-type ATPase, partial [Flavobacteriales bacterium]